MNTSLTIQIKSLHRDYDVCFSSELGELATQLTAYRSHYFVIDETVAKTYPDLLDAATSLGRVYTVKVSEDTKTLSGVQSLINWLMTNQAVRSSKVIAVGGGIVQDLVTFTSCIYYRGIDYVLVPTTLLSMCDSSIGAKCGINHGDYKNQLGVIYAPAAVHICSEFLDSLADTDIASGYGELLKLALTESEAQFKQLLGTVNENGLRSSALIELVRASLLTKKRVIELDEYEKDFRRILNYGHTFGHALESLSRYSLPHGLGVAWGIDVVNFLAVQRGLLQPEIREQVRSFISEHLHFHLGVFPSATDLIDATRRDKKVMDGSLKLILLANFGDLRITSTNFDAELLKQVDQYLSHENVFS